MNRYVLAAVSLLAAPALTFVGWYADGRGLIPSGTGLIVSSAGMFICPFAVSALVCRLLRPSSNWTRTWAFIVPLVIQLVLIFTAIQPGLSSYQMGFARRLGSELPVIELASCATDLQAKFRSGTLQCDPKPASYDSYPFGAGFIVSEKEVPNNIRRHFSRVVILKTSDSDEDQIFFVLTSNSGIVCDGREHVSDLRAHSISEHLHAYRLFRP